MLIQQRVCGFDIFKNQTIQNLIERYKDELWFNMFQFYFSSTNSSYISTTIDKLSLNKDGYCEQSGNAKIEPEQFFNYIEYLGKFGEDIKYNNKNIQFEKLIKGDELKIFILNQWENEKEGLHREPSGVNINNFPLVKDINNSDEEDKFRKKIKDFFCTYDYYFKMIINVVRIGNQDYSFYTLMY